MSRARHWCFTLNNPAIDADQFRESITGLTGFVYLVFQMEEGVNGTPHFQGFMSFQRPVRFETLRRVLEGAHLEVARGSPAQNREYCTKEQGRLAGPWEFGSFPDRAGQGKRSDLDDAIASLRGGGLQAVVDDHPAEFVKYSKGLKDLRLHDMKKRPRSDDVKVILLIGNPGVGKTRYVTDQVPDEDLFRLEPGSTWFDTYDGESTLLVDDFAGAASSWRLDYLLCLLDRYKMRVAVKGSHTFLHCDTIYITTNVHPYSWFGWKGRGVQYWALLRRFTHVYVFEDEPEPVLLTKEVFKTFCGGATGPTPGAEFGTWKVEASTDPCLVPDPQESYFSNYLG